jgi:hypothetical protein
MICLCKKCEFFFLKDLLKLICKHRRGTWFHLKIVKILQAVFFSKGKNETKEEVLNKSKSLGKIFEVVLLGVHSYKVHSFDIYKKTCLNPSIFLMQKRFMDECMYA